MIAGATAWLIADRPAEQRRLSTLFDLFAEEDAIYGLAVMLDKKEVSNRAAKAAFASFLQLPDQNTRPSVLGSVQSHLRLFDSDMTRRLTDTTTMDLDGLVRSSCIVPCLSWRALVSLTSIAESSASMSERIAAMAVCSSGSGIRSVTLRMLVLLIPETFVPTAKKRNCRLASAV